MKLDVLCIGPVMGETIYTTKTLDPGMLPKRIRTMMQSGARTRAQDVVFGCGGGGYIAALALARLGLKPAIATEVGQDSIGSEAIRRLVADGIPTSLIVQMSHIATAMTTLIRSTQDETFEVGYSPANGYGKKLVSTLADVRADWLYIHGPFTDLATLKSILAWAKKSRVQSVVRVTQADIAQARRAIKVLANASICIFDIEDAELLTHQLEPDAALVALRESGLHTVIVQDGTSCVRAIHDGFLYGAKGGRKPALVNSTGTTEVFGPAFLAQYLRTSDFAAALDFGLIASRSVGSYIGSEAGLLKSLAHRSGKVSKKFV